MVSDELLEDLQDAAGYAESALNLMLIVDESAAQKDAVLHLRFALANIEQVFDEVRGFGAAAGAERPCCDNAAPPR